MKKKTQPKLVFRHESIGLLERVRLRDLRGGRIADDINAKQTASRLINPCLCANE